MTFEEFRFTIGLIRLSLVVVVWIVDMAVVVVMLILSVLLPLTIM